MTRVKICGVTLADDAGRAAAAGADFIGLNFWPRSKRYLSLQRAPLIASVARSMGSAKLVGVFVDADIEDIQEIAATVDLDIIQLHGDESPDEVERVAMELERPVWKALSIASAQDIAHLDIWPVEAILLDTPTPGRGGSGATFNWTLASDARQRFPNINIVLAGGLTPANVATAIAAVGPWAVDVASGVEAAPGIKDAGKLDAFVRAVRSDR